MGEQHKCEIVQKPDHCHPQHPCPAPSDDHQCEGGFEGKITLDCCCPQLKTRTFVINVGPQQEPQLRAFVQNTAQAWENGGYVVQAVNLLDTGAGWMFVLTVGWYV